MILKRDFGQWVFGDIRQIVETLIMVEHRVDRSEKEDISCYEVIEDGNINNEAIDIDVAKLMRNSCYNIIWRQNTTRGLQLIERQ
jgi:hypothetical protein